MIVLKESTALQTVKYVPTRLNVDANYVFVRNETTNVEESYQINVQKDSFYSYFNMVFDLKQGHFYTLEIKYYGVINGVLDYHLVNWIKVFCTNQNVDTYSVNDEQYVTNRDEIIFYE